MDIIKKLIEEIDISFISQNNEFVAFLKEKNELSDAQLAKLEKIKVAIESIKSDIVNQIEKLNTDLQNSQNEFNALKSAQQETIAAFEEKMNSLTLLISAKEETSNELDLKIQSFQSMYDAFIIKRKETSQEIDNIQIKLLEKEGLLRATESSISSLSKKEESLKLSVGELTNQIDILNSDIRKKTESVSILEKRISDIKNK